MSSFSGTVLDGNHVVAGMSRGGARRWLAVACGLVAVGCGAPAPDNPSFDAAYHDQRAAEVTVKGVVSGVLADSPPRGDGAHERFTLTVDGVSLEIDHNLSLAPRVPVHAGDTVVVHGQFEPDPGHPVIHYTHHATGAHEGGWIELGGNTYQ